MSDRDRQGVSGDDDTVSVATPPPNATIGSGAYPLVIGRDQRTAQTVAAPGHRQARRSSLLVVAEERSLAATLDPLMRGGGLAAYEVTVASQAAQAMRLLQERSWHAYVFDEPSFGLLSWLPDAERGRIERRSIVITALEHAGPIALTNALTIPAARLNRFSLDNALWQVMRHQQAQPSQAPDGDSLYDVLLRLARSDLGREQDLSLALRPVVEAAAGSLRVGRASVWQLVDSPKRLRCAAMFDARAGEHAAGLEVAASICPVYCMSLHNHRIMAIEDALRDSRSCELADGYLAPMGIGALLDAPLYLDGAVAGVLCLAHVGGSRRWSDEEQRAAAAFADYAQLVMLAHRRRAAESELAARKAELAQARETDVLGRMAGGVAHEFGNLLTVISGRAEVLARALAMAGPAERIDDARAVLAACERASGLVRQLQALTRTAPGARAQVDVDALTREVCAALACTLDRRIEVRHVPAPRAPRIEADAGELRRALLTLALEARDRMPDGGVLTVSIAAGHDEHGRDWVEFAVADTGEPASEATRDLGQPEACARAHGGELSVENAAAGGTIARLRLPAAPPVPGEPAERRPGGGTLLVIDDDEEVRRTIAGMLSFFGFEVLEAADAFAGIRLYGERRQDIDLVLLDLAMPDMDGRDCFRALRLVDRGLRCLLVSGQAAEQAIADCLAGGALGLVRKPFTMAELVKAVEQALATRHAAV
jgi:CheY-like chemotaxis protein/signal transduction histidine kinase